MVTISLKQCWTSMIKQWISVMNLFKKLLILILICLEREMKSKFFGRLKIFTLLNYYKYNKTY